MMLGRTLTLALVAGSVISGIAHAAAINTVMFIPFPGYKATIKPISVTSGATTDVAGTHLISYLTAIQKKAFWTPREAGDQLASQIINPQVDKVVYRFDFKDNSYVHIKPAQCTLTIEKDGTMIQQPVCVSTHSMTNNIVTCTPQGNVLNCNYGGL